jgi:hypothetical protein
MNSQSSRIELHVERLVLSGFAAGAERVIEATFREELARLLTARGMAAPAGSAYGLERVDAGTVTLPSASDPQAAGREIASAVYGSLSR